MNNERTMNTHREGSAAGRREVHSNVMSVVMTAFFAAVIFLGIQSFRIPLPFAVGTPFLHFGHIFVMLSIVCLGGKRSAVSGVLGLIIFDILNGYLHAIPNVFVSTIIKCLFVGAVFSVMKRRAAGERKKEYMAAVICLDFVWNHKYRSRFCLVGCGTCFTWQYAQRDRCGRGDVHSGYDYQCRLYRYWDCSSLYPCKLGLPPYRLEMAYAHLMW